MLVDAAKHGDVEIPYFCYEPKLGNPVGACRMCLVEIEGIPKLQTSCSTPVKDGMVVHTQTDRVRHAQNAVVEFLLVNHPLDCPVCDKGGECPLQDITFGWGLGRSRFIEPKRHFVKPLALSPLVAIDRERCILCYRCVRFSQEVAEDYQLIFAERGAHTFVATHDGHPYVAPFSGNIIELCPVGALTSQPYRFRARPWDIEGAGGICTLCPSQCNVTVHRARREGDARARPRPPRGRRRLAVRQGPLRLPGDPRRRADHRAAGARRRRAARGVAGSARSRRPPGWHATGAASARSSAARPPTRRASCSQRLMREGLDSADIDSRAAARRSRSSWPRALAAPAPAGDGPRPRVRPHRARARLRAARRRADPRPADPQGRAPARRAARGRHRAPERARRERAARRSATRPGGEARVPGRARSAALGGGAGRRRRARAALAELLRDGGEDIVIVWGERLGADGAAALLRIAERLGLAERDGRRPARDSRRRQRARPARGGRAARRRAGLRRRSPAPGPRRRARSPRPPPTGEITALLPVPDRSRARAARPRRCGSARCTAPRWSSPTPRCSTEGMREHANVVFPAESYAEKEGTVVHPTAASSACARRSRIPAQVRAGWSVLAEIARRVGLDLGVLTSRDGVRAARRARSRSTRA